MSAEHKHHSVRLPAGVRLGELCQGFDEVTNYVHVGQPSARCAGCGKPFTAARKRRGVIKLIPVGSPLPMIYANSLCGFCCAGYRRGGARREKLIKAVEAFIDGPELTV